MDPSFLSEIRQRQHKIDDLYEYEGCQIGRGTYGIVYKAKLKNSNSTNFYALKVIEGPGVSLSATREISILREVKHKNVIYLQEVHMDFTKKRVWLVFDYSEYDLWQMIKHLSSMKSNKRSIENLPKSFVKSILHQILEGIQYLHQNYIMHRDLKPANILVMGDGPQRGTVKIADLGFSRLFCNPLRSLVEQDPIVVTRWYRAPELLLGSHHYTKSIDIWGVGCIFAELITLEPLFIARGDDNKFSTAYHRGQLDKIFSVIGFPKESDWNMLRHLSEYKRLSTEFRAFDYSSASLVRYMEKQKVNLPPRVLAMLPRFFSYNPQRRISAEEALADVYFKEEPLPLTDIFGSSTFQFPMRKFYSDSSEERNAKR